MDTKINYKSKYIAIAIVFGHARILHTTTDSTLCSYGVPRWEDDLGTDFGQVDIPHPTADIILIVDIDDATYNRLYGVDDGDPYGDIYGADDGNDD